MPLGFFGRCPAERNLKFATANVIATFPMTALVELQKPSPHLPKEKKPEKPAM
jgi:hypothetical protein